MSAHLSPEAFLTNFLLEEIATQPTEKQILLYRAVAARTDDETLRKDCQALADDLEHAQSKQRKLALDFKRRAEA